MVLLSETSSSIKSSAQTDKILTTLFLRWLITKEVSLHIIQELKLNIYSYYELDYIFFIIKSLIDQNLNMLEQLATKFAQEILSDNLLTSDKRKELTQTEKMLLDEITIMKSLKFTYSSMNLIVLAYKDGDNMKFVDSRKKERVRITNRFKHLEFLSFLVKTDSDSYEEFKKTVKGEVGRNKKSKLDTAELLLKKAETLIKDLKNVEDEKRNVVCNDNDYLGSVMKAIISNRLFISKLRKEEEKKTLCYEFKYNCSVPVLSIN